MPQPAPTLTLSNGVAIPALGLGTWPLKGDAARAAVASAIAQGYRLIDTAENYGNEDAVGAAVRAASVPRDEIFVTTKFNRRWHSVAGVAEACDASLRRLGLDHIDLLLIHWPNPDQGRYVEAFDGITRMVEAGKVRAAGVSNFKPAHLAELARAGFVPAVNQVQLSPYHPRQDVVAADRAAGTVTESWSPIKGDLLGDPAVTAVAAELGVTPAQAVLRWHVGKGHLPIPKSADPARQAANLDVFGFALTPAQTAALDALDRPGDAITDSDVFGH